MWEQLFNKIWQKKPFTPVFGQIIAIYYSKSIRNEYIFIAELLMYLEDALTSFIFGFYNFDRRLIAKLQKKCNFYPQFLV